MQCVPGFQPSDFHSSSLNTVIRKTSCHFFQKGLKPSPVTAEQNKNTVKPVLQSANSRLCVVKSWMVFPQQPVVCEPHPR